MNKRVAIIFASVIVVLPIALVNCPFLKTWFCINKDLSGWWQAITSVLAIIAAILLAHESSRNEEKRERERVKRNANIFVAKNIIKIQSDLKRMERAVVTFPKLMKHSVWSQAARDDHDEFITTIFNMQLLSIKDFDNSYDLSPRALSDISKAQINFVKLFRALSNDGFFDEASFNNSSSSKFLSTADRNFLMWSKENKKNTIVKYLGWQKTLLGRIEKEMKNA